MNVLAEIVYSFNIKLTAYIIDFRHILEFREEKQLFPFVWDFRECNTLNIH